MPNRFSIVEPHPSVPRAGGYIASGGRGGAGNFRRYRADELTSGPTASGPPSRHALSGSRTSSSTTVPSLPRATSRPYASTGIGGAGNMFARAETEERVFQFDEEMVKRRDAASTPVYHIGRGGGGNWVHASSASSSVAAQQLKSKTSSTEPARFGSTSSDASSSASSDSGSELVAGAAQQVRRSVEGVMDRLRGRRSS